MIEANAEVAVAGVAAQAILSSVPGHAISPAPVLLNFMPLTLPCLRAQISVRVLLCDRLAVRLRARKSEHEIVSSGVRGMGNKCGSGVCNRGGG